MGRIDIPLAGGTDYDTFEISEWGESIAPDTAYVLISVGGLEYWLVAQVEGIRRIDYTHIRQYNGLRDKYKAS